MIIKDNCYVTDKSKKRVLLDKLFLNTRFYFYLKYLFILLDARKKAVAGTFDDKEYCKTSDKTFRLIEDCGGKFDIAGLNNITEINGPVVFVCNHMSILETFILPGLILPYKQASFIVKKSLVTGKFFGKIMRATKPIAVTRSDPKRDYKKVMREGVRLLNSGRSIIVFPQGIRGQFKAEDFGSIGEKLAKRANVPVIPIALKTDFWSTGKFLLDFGKIYRNRKVYFNFGKPYENDMNIKERHAAIVEFIASRLKKWED